MVFNFTKLASTAFLAYMFHNLYQLYRLYTPETCSDTDFDVNCYRPKMVKNLEGSFELVQMRVYLSQRKDNLGQLITKIDDMQMAESFKKEFNVTIPKSVAQNGFLFAHVILLPHGFDDINPINSKWRVHAASQMIVFQEPTAKTFQLLDDSKIVKNQNNNKVIQITAHFRSILPIRIAVDSKSFKKNKVSEQLNDFLTIVEDQEYLPMLFIDEMSMRSKHLVELTEEFNRKKMNFTIEYEPTSVAKLLLLTTSATSVHVLTKNGFKDKDIDEIRGLFTETSITLLMITFFVSTLHLLFDALAFKNDISFWKERKSMVGLSSKTLLWRCFSQTIIFLYLFDQDTSLLVLIPSGISTLIEYWKVTIAYKISFSLKNGFTIGKNSKEENETDSFDAEAMKYLSFILLPLIFVGAIYSLFYQPHKSWQSWIIQTAANGVYAFGFLFMLPQLFVNYKLKSVAHLPWRAFMYKAFNTFIDDLFAFVITMPTAHRMACFRDDIVFIVYLYQRWLYPVDYTRINEYGENGDKKEEIINENEEKVKEVQTKDDGEIRKRKSTKKT